MTRVWQIVNTLLFILSIYAGSVSMDAEALRKTNPDAIFCSVVFVFMLLFPLGAVTYSVLAKKQETLRRPSWSRFSFDWWHDPLQCLLSSTCAAAGLAIGAAFHLNGTTYTGFWTFMTFSAMFVGLLVGQVFVYAGYRNRLVEPDTPFSSEIVGARRGEAIMFLGLFSIASFTLAYLSATQNKVLLFWGVGTARHETLYTRADHPQLFAALMISFVAIGLVLIGSAAWLAITRRSADRSRLANV